MPSILSRRALASGAPRSGIYATYHATGTLVPKPPGPSTWRGRACTRCLRRRTKTTEKTSSGGIPHCKTRQAMDFDRCGSRYRQTFILERMRRAVEPAVCFRFTLRNTRPCRDRSKGPYAHAILWPPCLKHRSLDGTSWPPARPWPVPRISRRTLARRSLRHHQPNPGGARQRVRFEF
jgi:hypothetical protein